MNYQVLDVKVKDTEETAKLYTYFLDNSREIAPERVRPVIVICPGGGYEWVSEREAEPIALKFTVLLRQLTIRRHSASLPGRLHICGSMRQNIILIRTK